MSKGNLAVKAPFQLALEAGLEVKVRKGEVVVRCTDETAKYLASEHVQIVVGPFCRCRSFRLPHELSRHSELRKMINGQFLDGNDWRTWEERRDFGGDVLPSRRSNFVPQDVDEVLQEWSA